MAKARCNNSQKAGVLKAQPASTIPELPADVIAAQQTGDTIPTPDNVPAVRKKAVELQHELQGQASGSVPVGGATIVHTTAGAVPPGSPTKPAAESHFVHPVLSNKWRSSCRWDQVCIHCHLPNVSNPLLAQAQSCQKFALSFVCLFTPSGGYEYEWMCLCIVSVLSEYDL